MVSYESQRTYASQATLATEAEMIRQKFPHWTPYEVNQWIQQAYPGGDKDLGVIRDHARGELNTFQADLLATGGELVIQPTPAENSPPVATPANAMLGGYTTHYTGRPTGDFVSTEYSPFGPATPRKFEDPNIRNRPLSGFEIIAARIAQRLGVNQPGQRAINYSRYDTRRSF